MPRRRRAATLAVVLLTVLALSPAASAVVIPKSAVNAPQSTATGPRSSAVRIRANASIAGPQIVSGQVKSGYTGNYCLDDHQGSIGGGNPLDVFSCNGNFDSQLWTIEADGSIRLQGKYCIGDNGGQVELFGCDTNATQDWVPQSNGTLENSGTGTCLDASSSGATSLGLVTCSISPSPPPGQVWTEPAVTTANQTASAMVQLQLDYDDSTNSTPGLFCSISDTSAPAGNCWWWSANELRTVIDFLQSNSGAEGYSHYENDIASTYAEGYYDHSSVPCLSGSAMPTAFENDYFDDTAWWGLTWLDAYELTKNANYLDTAENIFQYIQTCAAEPATSQCSQGGVIQYDKPGSQGPVDTIATALYITLGARLYQADPATQSGDLHNSSGTGAADEMTWLLRDSTLPDVYSGEPWDTGGLYLMNDAEGSCPAGSAQKYTYNQGQTIGALTALYQTRYGSDPQTYLTEAENLANTVIADTWQGSGDTGLYSTPPLVYNGVLSEPCSPDKPADWPGGCDVSGASNTFLQFKGVFVRNLYCLAQQADPGSAYSGFLATSADSVWANDQDTTTTQGASDLNQFGFVWTKFDNSALVNPTQGSAADALIASEGGTALSC